MSRAVSCIMSNLLTVIGADCAIYEVEEIPKNHKLRCVSVMGADGRYFGVLSVPDILYLYGVRDNLKLLVLGE